MLYTRRGDDGTSGLFGECRMSKDSLAFDALGALDELNSLLGICFVKAHERDILDINKNKADFMAVAPILRSSQENLFIVQAQLAGADKSVTENHVVEVERMISDIEHHIKNPNAFVISGATELSAFLDFARTVARRTERTVISACKERGLAPHTMQYLNRLSSLLYALARVVAQDSCEQEPSPKY